MQICYNLFMLSLPRLLYRLQIPLALILPAWIGFGRGFFGAAGWLTLLTFIFVMPLLCIWLLLLSIVNHSRPDIKATKQCTKTDVYLLGTSYLAAVCFGFFMVDGGDTSDSIGSAFSMLLGHRLVAVSELIAGISAVVGLTALVGATIYGIVQLIRGRRTQRAAPPLQK